MSAFKTGFYIFLILCIIYRLIVEPVDFENLSQYHRHKESVSDLADISCPATVLGTECQAAFTRVFELKMANPDVGYSVSKVLFTGCQVRFVLSAKGV